MTIPMGEIIRLTINGALEVAAQMIEKSAGCDCGMGDGFDIGLHELGCEIHLAAKHAQIVRDGKMPDEAQASAGEGEGK